MLLDLQSFLLFYNKSEKSPEPFLELTLFGFESCDVQENLTKTDVSGLGECFGVLNSQYRRLDFLITSLLGRDWGILFVLQKLSSRKEARLGLVAWAG